VGDISSPVGASVYLSPARKLLMILFLVGGIVAAFSWAAVKADTETKRCNSLYWHFFVYKFEPELYAKKCGCPNNLDFSFSCNSKYLGILH
jgi:hypothetical protein